MTLYIVSFAFVLGILIFFHELGHFLIARLCGVGVEKFSLGFGPRIFGKKIGITDYRISAIPLGGYVKMVGDEPDGELAEEDIPLAFNHKPVYKRIAVVAAGPLFNILLAIIIFSFIHIHIGYLVPRIGSLSEDSPALIGGLKKGDRIVRIDDTQITAWMELTKVISSSDGAPLNIQVMRDDQLITKRISPKLTVENYPQVGEIKRYIIGITPSGDKYFDAMRSFRDGFTDTYNICVVMIDIVGKLITGKMSRDVLGGPLVIAQQAGEQAKQGYAHLFHFIALLSINLAILNLLPIPPLDGGHLLYFFIEMIMGRPVNLRIREISQQAGMLLLMMLMIYVFYNDITRMFFTN